MVSLASATAGVYKLRLGLEIKTESLRYRFTSSDEVLWVESRVAYEFLSHSPVLPAILIHDCQTMPNRTSSSATQPLPRSQIIAKDGARAWNI
jgi:hypothetical protein